MKKALNSCSVLPGDNDSPSANRPAKGPSGNRITPIRPAGTSGGPCAPLKNGRYERFAQHIASGESPADAYGLSGYRGIGASQSASRLLRRPEVAARVEDLKKDVAGLVIARTAVDRAWVVDKLVRIVERSMQAEARGAGEAVRALALLGKAIGMFEHTEQFQENPNLAERLRDGLQRARKHEREEKKRRDREKARAADSKNPSVPGSEPSRTDDGPGKIGTDKQVPGPTRS